MKDLTCRLSTVLILCAAVTSAATLPQGDLPPQRVPMPAGAEPRPMRVGVEVMPYVPERLIRQSRGEAVADELPAAQPVDRAPIVPDERIAPQLWRAWQDYLLARQLWEADQARYEAVRDMAQKASIPGYPAEEGGEVVFVQPLLDAGSPSLQLTMQYEQARLGYVQAYRQFGDPTGTLPDFGRAVTLGGDESSDASFETLGSLGGDRILVRETRIERGETMVGKRVTVMGSTYWCVSPSGATRWFGHGDALPGAPDDTLWIADHQSRKQLSWGWSERPDGRLFFVCMLATEFNANGVPKARAGALVERQPDGALRLLVRDGQPVPGQSGRWFQSFRAFRMADGSYVIAAETRGAGPQTQRGRGFWRLQDGSWTLLVEEESRNEHQSHAVVARVRGIAGEVWDPRWNLVVPLARGGVGLLCDEMVDARSRWRAEAVWSVRSEGAMRAVERIRRESLRWDGEGNIAFLRDEPRDETFGVWVGPSDAPACVLRNRQKAPPGFLAEHQVVLDREQAGDVRLVPGGAIGIRGRVQGPGVTPLAARVGIQNQTALWVGSAAGLRLAAQSASTPVGLVGLTIGQIEDFRVSGPGSAAYITDVTHVGKSCYESRAVVVFDGARSRVALRVGERLRLSPVISGVVMDIGFHRDMAFDREGNLQLQVLVAEQCHVEFNHYGDGERQLRVVDSTLHYLPGEFRGQDFTKQTSGVHKALVIVRSGGGSDQAKDPGAAAVPAAGQGVQYQEAPVAQEPAKAFLDRLFAEDGRAIEELVAGTDRARQSGMPRGEEAVFRTRILERTGIEDAALGSRVLAFTEVQGDEFPTSIAAKVITHWLRIENYARATAWWQRVRGDANVLAGISAEMQQALTGYASNLATIESLVGRTVVLRVVKAGQAKRVGGMSLQIEGIEGDEVLVRRDSYGLQRFRIDPSGLGLLDVTMGQVVEKGPRLRVVSRADFVPLLGPEQPDTVLLTAVSTEGDLWYGIAAPREGAVLSTLAVKSAEERTLHDFGRMAFDELERQKKGTTFRLQPFTQAGAVRLTGMVGADMRRDFGRRRSSLTARILVDGVAKVELTFTRKGQLEPVDLVIPQGASSLTIEIEDPAEAPDVRAFGFVLGPVR